MFIFPQGKKEISVLELLELQARARAIRSQLALEPVTKIELDSDNDSADSFSPKVVKNSTSTATTSDNNKDQTKKAKSSSTDVVQETNGMQIIKPSIPAVKPVRLKRNFRQRQTDDYDPDEDDETNAVVENCESKEAATKSGDEKDETNADNVKSDEKKRDEAERSPSPDLIPIIQEPETYCISSDSDEAGSSSVPKYITYPTVIREKLPETEDEKFLKKIKEGSGVDLRDLIKARRGGKQDDVSVDNSETIDTSNDATHSRAEISSRRASSPNKNIENSSEEISVKKGEEKLDKDTEPEEGELTDGDDQNEMDANQITILSSDDENDEKANKCDSGLVTQVENNVSENIEDETSSESSTSDNDSDTDSSEAPTFKEADDDDDIIDLGKDEELDFEMKEVEQSKTKNKKVKKTKKKVNVVAKSSETVSEATEAIKINEETNDNEDVSQCIETTEPTDNSDAIEPTVNNDASNEIEPAIVADPSEVIEVTICRLPVTNVNSIIFI